MTSTHLHNIRLLTLCDNHPGAIAVMKEMDKRFHNHPAYYTLCNELEKHDMYGSAIYHIWKDICSENYDTFLTYHISSIIENLKRVIHKNFS